jgi:ubiquinone/menaquinone biosynthesis C-methylase UbiE
MRMRLRGLAEKRADLVPRAAGKVLELGVGGGANFMFYDAQRVESVIGIDPSAELRVFANAAARPAGLHVAVMEGRAEALPFADQHIDTVVTTYTLCTVGDAAQALAEARRVLRPGGRLLFCEHGLAPDAGVQKWQRRLDPLWGKLFGGCHITRQPGVEVARLFRLERLEAGYMAKTPRVAGWTEWGEAVAG